MPPSAIDDLVRRVHRNVGIENSLADLVPKNSDRSELDCASLLIVVKPCALLRDVRPGCNLRVESQLVDQCLEGANISRPAHRDKHVRSLRTDPEPLLLVLTKFFWEELPATRVLAL